MAKTKIEWLRDPVSGKAGFSINPVKGLCPIACDYCYARRMYKRFKWNPEIRFDIQPLQDVERIKKPSRIFVGSTFELFGEWVKPDWMNFTFERASMFPEHTFIFLTKKPENLVKWSPFPKNCWIGVSATDGLMLECALYCLKDIEAHIKYISFEPLLEAVFPVPYIDFVKGITTTKADRFKQTGINWIIIGAQTPYSIKTAPKIEWIEEMLVVAYNSDTPVFMKDNLQPLLVGEWAGWKLRQEFPKGE